LVGLDTFWQMAEGFKRASQYEVTKRVSELLVKPKERLTLDNFAEKHKSDIEEIRGVQMTTDILKYRKELDEAREKQIRENERRGSVRPRKNQKRKKRKRNQSVTKNPAMNVM